MFSPQTVHKQTNHSKGEFVNRLDKTNTINDLENQNKLLKKAIKCRRSPKLLHQYMALHWYRQNNLNQFEDVGARMMVFLLDLKKLYPGFVDGNIQKGLELKEIDPPRPTPQDDNPSLCGSEDFEELEMLEEFIDSINVSIDDAIYDEPDEVLPEDFF